MKVDRPVWRNTYIKPPVPFTLRTEGSVQLVASGLCVAPPPPRQGAAPAGGRALPPHRGVAPRPPGAP